MSGAAFSSADSANYKLVFHQIIWLYLEWKIFSKSDSADTRFRNWDRKNKKRAGKKNTRRGCFASSNGLLPSILRGWNFSLTLRRNSNPWSSCPQLASVEKTSTANILPNLVYFSPPSLRQVINRKLTPKHSMAARGIGMSRCDMKVPQTNLSPCSQLYVLHPLPYSNCAGKNNIIRKKNM